MSDEDSLSEDELKLVNVAKNTLAVLKAVIEDEGKPDLPALNPKEEALTICQLGPVIFTELLKI